MALGDGDWVEGSVRWWWKYVFPAKDVFYGQLLGAERVIDPIPQPWRQATGELLEASAMLHAIGNVSDPATKSRLQTEIAAKVEGVYKQLSTHRG